MRSPPSFSPARPPFLMEFHLTRLSAGWGMKTLHRNSFETPSTRPLPPPFQPPHYTPQLSSEHFVQKILPSQPHIAVRCLACGTLGRWPPIDYPSWRPPYKFATVALGGVAAHPLITACTPLPAYRQMIVHSSTPNHCLHIDDCAQHTKPPMTTQAKITTYRPLLWQYVTHIVNTYSHCEHYCQCAPLYMREH